MDKIKMQTIPDAYNFLGSPTKILPVSRFSDVFIYPDQNSPIDSRQSGSLSRFRFPSLDCDFRDAALYFNVTLNATGSTYLRLSRNAKALIQRIRVQLGSLEIFNCDNANLLSIIVDNMTTSTPSQTGQLSIFEGTDPSQAVRNAQWQGGYTYALNFSRCHSFFNRLIPLSFINEQLTLEVFYAPGVNVIETDGSAPYYILSNLQFRFASVVFPEHYKKSIMDKINSSEGLNLSFTAWSSYTNTQLTTGVTSVSVMLPYRYLSLNAVVGVSIDSSIINNPAINSKFETYTGYNNITSWNLRINSAIYPQDKILSTTNALHEGEEVFYHSEAKTEEYYASQSWATKFLTALSLSQDNGNQDIGDNNAQVISGLNLTSSGAQLNFEASYSSNPINVTYQFFANYFVILKITANGGIILSY